MRRGHHGSPQSGAIDIALIALLAALALFVTYSAFAHLFLGATKAWALFDDEYQSSLYCKINEVTRKGQHSFASHVLCFPPRFDHAPPDTSTGQTPAALCLLWASAGGHTPLPEDAVCDYL